jgi:hypothetical protein
VSIPRSAREAQQPKTAVTRIWINSMITGGAYVFYIHVALKAP